MCVLSKKQKLDVYERDGYKCQLCGRDMDYTAEYSSFSVDHIMPLSRGGTNESDNLQTCCKSCNSRKGTKTTEEYIQYKHKVYNQQFFDLVIRDFQRFIDSGGNHFDYSVSVKEIIIKELY